MSHFSIYGDPDAEMRLKSFTGTSKNGKSVIRIEIECSTPWRFGYALEELGKVQDGQKPKKAPPKKPAKAKALALPPPQLMLPDPGQN